MKQDPRSDPNPSRGFLLAEMFEVLVVGLLLALLANRVSPRGLDLGRDYFKESPPPAVRVIPSAPASAAPTSDVSSSTKSADSAERLAEVSAEEALRWFEDPRHRSGSVVFVDARKESAFREGHIPGAYPLDRFYPEQQLPAVALASAMAEVVVVYCTGGTCEDSHYAAHQLVEAGIDRSRVRVFTGGFQEWSLRGWPVERGSRGGGPENPAQP